MAAPTLSEKDDAVPLDERAAFLSSAPRSGELSPFAQKLGAEAFVWLCSVVVFGNTIDFASNSQIERCTALCKYAITTGIISFIFTSFILLGQYLTWTNRIDKSTWFTSRAEMRVMMFLAVWWMIGVSTLSALEGVDVDGEAIAIPHTSYVAIVAGWLAFFGSIFGAYKAYHVGKEEQRSLHYAQVMAIQSTEEEEYANFS